jgi:hypothetical protein
VEKRVAVVPGQRQGHSRTLAQADGTRVVTALPLSRVLTEHR